MAFTWTEEAVAAARRHYMTEGLSAAETARRIGATRSAVIGKAHRMGWAAEREPLLAAVNLARTSKAARRVKPPRPAPAATAVPCTPRPWLERQPGECAWPAAGEGARTLSCAARTQAGSAYCPGHHAAMFTPPGEDQRAALERLADWVEAQQAPRRAREAG